MLSLRFCSAQGQQEAHALGVVDGHASCTHEAVINTRQLEICLGPTVTKAFALDMNLELHPWMIWTEAGVIWAGLTSSQGPRALAVMDLLF